MNISQALGILKPLGHTEAHLKSAYREAALKYHPDRNPDGLEIMKLINAAYEFLKKNLGSWTETSRDRNANPLDETFDALIKKIRHIPDLNIEICGTWLWVTGNTYPHRQAMKDLGMKFSHNKKAWYWHEEGYRKTSKRTFSLDEIRNTFGSFEIETEPLSALA